MDSSSTHQTNVRQISIIYQAYLQKPQAFIRNISCTYQAKLRHILEKDIKQTNLKHITGISYLPISDQCQAYLRHSCISIYNPHPHTSLSPQQYNPVLVLVLGSYVSLIFYLFQIIKNEIVKQYHDLIETDEEKSSESSMLQSHKWQGKCLCMKMTGISLKRIIFKRIRSNKLSLERI